MKKLIQWSWWTKHIPPAERVKPKNLALVTKLAPMNGYKDFSEYRRSDTVLITGDGWSLPEDVKMFRALGAPHDIYCINRSLLYFEEPINHWGAVDVEESIWFSQYLKREVMLKEGRILRHTMNRMPLAFDVHWTVPNVQLTENQKSLWTGNSGYFGVLTAIYMGYKKIILAGMPLDNGRHWYEPEGTPGPNWVGRAYRQWMDFKMQVPEAENVRALPGSTYSAFILGEATEEWLNEETASVS